MSVLPGDTDVVIVAYGPLPGDSVSADYVYENGWHIVGWAGRFADKIVYFRDSIQFQDVLGQPQQDNLNTETIIYKRQWAESAVDTTISRVNYSGAASLTLDNIISGTASVSGTHLVDVAIVTITIDSTVLRDISIEGTVSNLRLNEAPGGWLQNCPVTGTFGATASMSYQKDAGTPVTSDWSVSSSFLGGTLSVSTISGSTSWSYSHQVCIGPLP